MVATLPDKWCFDASRYSATYQTDKIYLGRGNSMPQHKTISVAIIFESLDEQKDFFKWYADETSHGAKDFYAKLPLYADNKYYLVAFDSEIVQNIYPDITITAKLTLVHNRTKDNNQPPTTKDIAVTVKEGSKNNYITLLGADANGDALTYSITQQPANGTITLNPSGLLIYTPKLGYEGDDLIMYRAFDGLHYSSPNQIAITVEARGKEFFKVQNRTTATMDDFVVTGGLKTTVKEKV